MRRAIHLGSDILGRTVVPKLKDAGHVVRVLTRNPSTEGHILGNLGQIVFNADGTVAHIRGPPPSSRARPVTMADFATCDP
jgi:hypothetical protein